MNKFLTKHSNIIVDHIKGGIDYFFDNLAENSSSLTNIEDTYKRLKMQRDALDLIDRETQEIKVPKKTDIPISAEDRARAEHKKRPLAETMSWTPMPGVDPNNFDFNSQRAVSNLVAGQVVDRATEQKVQDREIGKAWANKITSYVDKMSEGKVDYIPTSILLSLMHEDEDGNLLGYTPRQKDIESKKLSMAAPSNIVKSVSDTVWNIPGIVDPFREENTKFFPTWGNGESFDKPGIKNELKGLADVASNFMFRKLPSISFRSKFVSPHIFLADLLSIPGSQYSNYIVSQNEEPSQALDDRINLENISDNPEFKRMVEYSVARYANGKNISELDKKLLTNAVSQQLLKNIDTRTKLEDGKAYSKIGYFANDPNLYKQIEKRYGDEVFNRSQIDRAEYEQAKGAIDDIKHEPYTEPSIQEESQEEKPFTVTPFNPVNTMLDDKKSQIAEYEASLEQKQPIQTPNKAAKAVSKTTKAPLIKVTDDDAAWKKFYKFNYNDPTEWLKRAAGVAIGGGVGHMIGGKKGAIIGGIGGYALTSVADKLPEWWDKFMGAVRA